MGLRERTARRAEKGQWGRVVCESVYIERERERERRAVVREHLLCVRMCGALRRFLT